MPEWLNGSTEAISLNLSGTTMIKNSKILIVDDEPRLCNSLKILLCTQSYKVKICNSGKEALTYLTNDKFDLVLLDIFMEDMNGLQVIERIKNQKIDTPVIIMTGNTSAELTVKAFRMGAIDYLKKPFETQELFSSVKNFLTQSLLKKESSKFTPAKTGKLSQKMRLELFKPTWPQIPRA